MEYLTFHSISEKRVVQKARVQKSFLVVNLQLNTQNGGWENFDFSQKRLK